MNRNEVRIIMWLTRNFIKNSDILIVPLSSVSKLKNKYSFESKVFHRIYSSIDNYALNISAHSSSLHSKPVSCNPFVNSSNDNAVFPSSSIRRKALPSPIIPHAPRAKHSKRNFSMADFSVPSSSARWHFLISSDSPRDIELEGRFAIWNKVRVFVVCKIALLNHSFQLFISASENRS